MLLNQDIETDAMHPMQQDFASLLEKSFQVELKPGGVVVGEILRVEKDGLLVDVGGKSEGFCPMKEIPTCNNYDELTQEFESGQVREFFILREVEDDIQYLLSIRRVAASKNWEKLVEMKEAGEIVEVKVSGMTKGGILVNVLDLKGFIPASQLRVAKTLQDLIGDGLPAKILEVDKSKNKLILSHRQAIFEQKSAMRSETLNKLNEGDIVEGEIVKITDFGAFVDINGIDGLLPLSEITWRRIKHPSEVVTLGQQIQVCVLTVDKELQRISLSLKRLQPDPWETVSSQFESGQEIEAPITKMLASGILAELVPGVEAYCSYHSLNGAANGNRGVEINDRYTFKIVSILVQERRITLERV